MDLAQTGKAIQCEAGDCTLTISNGRSRYLLGPEGSAERYANTWARVSISSCAVSSLASAPRKCTATTAEQAPQQ